MIKCEHALRIRDCWSMMIVTMMVAVGGIVHKQAKWSQAPSTSRVTKQWPLQLSASFRNCFIAFACLATRGQIFAPFFLLQCNGEQQLPGWRRRGNCGWLLENLHIHLGSALSLYWACSHLPIYGMPVASAPWQHCKKEQILLIGVFVNIL